MRKIFALILMIALVPFMTGCRIDGLWGYDDDESTPAASNYNRVSPVIKVPAAGGVLASLKGTDASKLECYIKATHASSISGWLKLNAVVSATEVFFTLPAGITLTADQLTLGTGNRMQFKFKTVKTDGSPVEVLVVTVPVTNAIAATSTVGDYGYAIQISFTAGGVTVTFTESTTPVTTIT
ncbi:MAG TPA: hypothetical protein PKM25_03685, partial [Candidatus Ozemobacteraceae bacterium]|nr:hypothetical protein [Candidatus Ozemobacteraceae bacterium]